MEPVTVRAAPQKVTRQGNEADMSGILRGDASGDVEAVYRLAGA
jgi:hypothetical protein